MRSLGHRQHLATEYEVVLDRRAHGVRDLLMTRYPVARLESVLSVEHGCLVVGDQARVHASLPWSELVGRAEDAVSPWVVMSG